jgi:hypothetical protein
MTINIQLKTQKEVGLAKSNQDLKSKRILLFKKHNLSLLRGKPMTISFVVLKYRF